jgi:hypothetical protein
MTIKQIGHIAVCSFRRTAYHDRASPSTFVACTQRSRYTTA